MGARGETRVVHATSSLPLINNFDMYSFPHIIGIVIRNMIVQVLHLPVKIQDFNFTLSVVPGKIPLMFLKETVNCRKNCKL